MARRSAPDTVHRTSKTEDEKLPALTEVRPRAHDPSTGDPLVVLRFANGAKVRYRAATDGIREQWFGPSDEAPARLHGVSAPVEHGADGTVDVPLASRPSTHVLSDRALCTVST